MQKFTVTIAADLPSYAQIEVEASSQEAAERMVEKSLAEHGTESEFYDGADAWSHMWGGVENLRMVPLDLPFDPSKEWASPEEAIKEISDQANPAEALKSVLLESICAWDLKFMEGVLKRWNS